jgi:hypothetical protein
VLAVKGLYEYQELNFVGDYGENDFVEDYTTKVRGESPRRCRRS